MARGDMAARLRSPSAPPEPVAPSAPVKLGSAAVASQVGEARAAPRSLAQFERRIDDLLAYAGDEVDTLIYAREHEGKMTHGPSSRMAELLLYAWGNARAESSPITIGRDYVEAEGVCLDVETNTAHADRVRRSTRRIGKRLSHEEVLAAITAAGSIAKRNAIMHAIPQLVWAKVVRRVEEMIAGDLATLPARRAALMEALLALGIEPDRILRALHVGAVEEIDRTRLVTLHGLAVALQAGDVDPDELFPPEGDDQTRLEGAEGFSPAFVVAELGGDAPQRLTSAAEDQDTGRAAPSDVGEGGEPVQEGSAPAVTAESAPPDPAEPDLSPEEVISNGVRDVLIAAEDETELDVAWGDHAVIIAELPVALQLALRAHQKKRRKELQSAAPPPPRTLDRDETVDLFAEREVA